MGAAPSILLTYSRVCTNNEHGKVRTMGRESKYGRLHVLLVAGKVDESDEFGRCLANLLCADTSRVVHYLSTAEIPPMKNFYFGCAQLTHRGLIASITVQSTAFILNLFTHTYHTHNGQNGQIRNLLSRVTHPWRSQVPWAPLLQGLWASAEQTLEAWPDTRRH